MGTYNGHKNYAYWNVSLWINNDEGLYNMAREAVRRNKTKDRAAREIVDSLKDCGIEKTPDGARYSRSTVRAALVEM